MRTDLILSVVKDRRWEDLDCYAISAARSGFTGRKVMLVEDVPGDAQYRLGSLGFEVYPIRSGMPGLHFQSSRFFLAAEFLANHRDQFRNVIWTDACDVVFQEDPVPAFARALGTFQLAAVKEGWAIKNQPINDVWIKRLPIDPEVYQYLREQEVLCSGTIAGNAEAMLFLFTQMCALMKDEMQGADQGVFNYVIRTHPFCNITRIPEPEDGFVATLGIFNAPSDQSIWTIKSPILDWETGLVMTPDRSKRYAVQHQYNRRYGILDPNGTWREVVERRYRYEVS